MICQQTRRPGRQGVYLFCIPPYLRPVSPPRSSVHPTPNTQPPQLALRDPKRGCRWTRAHSTACQAIYPGLVGDGCDGMQHLSQRAAPLVTSCIQRMDAQYSVPAANRGYWFLECIGASRRHHVTARGFLDVSSVGVQQAHRMRQQSPAAIGSRKIKPREKELGPVALLQGWI